MKKIFLLSIFFTVFHIVGISQQFDWIKTVYASYPSFFPYNQGKDIVVDSIGNVYTTGYFYYHPGDVPVDFDPGPGVFNFNRTGTYIQKLDRNGNFIWAKNFPESLSGGGSNIEDIAIDKAGNIYAAGAFSGTADLDPGPATLNYTANIGSDLFVVKLNSLGEFQWVKIMPYTAGTYFPYVSDLTIDQQNNILISGNIHGEIDFDPSANTALFLAPNNEGFVVKLRSNGDYLWARQLGFTDLSEVTAMETDNLGNVYLSGNTAAMDIDNGPETLFVNTFGMGDSYVMKLDMNGDIIWVKNFGNSTNIDNPNDLTIDKLGNIYATGYFKGTAYFPNTSDTLSIISTGNSNVFVTKVNTNGEFIWAKAFNGNDTIIGEDGKCIGVDSIGNVYVLGSFKDSIDVDPGPATAWITAQSYYNFSRSIFVCKLDNDGNFIRAKATNGGGDVLAKAMVIDNDANILFTGAMWTWFAGPIDVDPDTSIYEVEETYIDPIYVAKWKQCNAGYSTINESACENYTWNNQTYFESGSYTKSFTTSTGCDSIARLNLIILNKSVSQNIQICSGETFNIGSQTLNQSGIYQTVFPASNGCDSLVTTHLTVDSLVVQISLTGNVYSAINAPVDATYQWLDCESNLAALIGQINPTYTATENGIYALVINAENCRDTSECLAYSNVGILDIKENSIMHFYPNPVHDVFTISFKNKETYQGELSMYDTNGKLVYSTKVFNGKLDVSQLARGVYTLRFKNDSNTEYHRLIKI